MQRIDQLNLKSSLLQTIKKSLHVRKLPKSVLYEEGDQANSLYVVLEGSVLLMQKSPQRNLNGGKYLEMEKERELTVVQEIENEIVGDYEFVRKTIRKQTAICYTQCCLVVIKDKPIIQQLVALLYKQKLSVIKELQMLPFFKELTVGQLYRISVTSKSKSAGHESILYEQGSLSQELFVLRKGQAKIYMRNKDFISLQKPTFHENDIRSIKQLNRFNKIDVLVCLKTPSQLLGQDGLFNQPFRRRYKTILCPNSQVLCIPRNPLVHFVGVQQNDIQDRLKQSRTDRVETNLNKIDILRNASLWAQKNPLIQKSSSAKKSLQIKRTQLVVQNSVFFINTHKPTPHQKLQLKNLIIRYNQIQSFSPKRRKSDSNITKYLQQRKIKSAVSRRPTNRMGKSSNFGVVLPNRPSTSPVVQRVQTGKRSMKIFKPSRGLSLRLMQSRYNIQ